MKSLPISPDMIYSRNHFSKILCLNVVFFLPLFFFFFLPLFLRFIYHSVYIVLGTQRHNKWKCQLWAELYHIHAHTIFCTVTHLHFLSAKNPLSRELFKQDISLNGTFSLCEKRWVKLP